MCALCDSFLGFMNLLVFSEKKANEKCGRVGKIALRGRFLGFSTKCVLYDPLECPRTRANAGP